MMAFTKASRKPTFGIESPNVLAHVKVDSLVDYLNTKLIRTKCFKLSLRAKHIYASALQYKDKA